jgi:hypothetical protein
MGEVMMEMVPGVVAMSVTPGFGGNRGNGDASHDRRENRSKGAGLGQAVQQIRFRHIYAPHTKLALAFVRQLGVAVTKTLQSSRVGERGYLQVKAFIEFLGNYFAVQHFY